MTRFQYIDLLGTPFQRGGRGPDTYDCYGLVCEMYRRRGIVVPDFESPGTLEEVADIIAREEVRWRRVPLRTPGTLVTFRVDGLGAHVGYMLEGDNFLHAIESAGVAVDRLTNGAYKPLAAYDYV